MTRPQKFRPALPIAESLDAFRYIPYRMRLGYKGSCSRASFRGPVFILDPFPFHLNPLKKIVSKRPAQIADPDRQRTNVKLVGLQRWFCDVIEQAIPVRYVALVAHCGFVLWAMLALAAIFFSFGWIMRLPLLAVFAATCLLYVFLIRKGHELANDPMAELEWYQQPFWEGLLALARAKNWADTKRSADKIIDLRGESVSDQRLVGVPDLKTCEVLDLEGSAVTDHSLTIIGDIKPLKCLVLKNTRVTHDAIVRLQQRKPVLWIWY